MAQYQWTLSINSSTDFRKNYLLLNRASLTQWFNLIFPQVLSFQMRLSIALLRGRGGGGFGGRGGGGGLFGRGRGSPSPAPRAPPPRAAPAAPPVRVWYTTSTKAKLILLYFSYKDEFISLLIIGNYRRVNQSCLVRIVKFSRLQAHRFLAIKKSPKSATGNFKLSYFWRQKFILSKKVQTLHTAAAPRAPGLMGQMAATAGGVAVGSVVGHGLSQVN